MARLLVDLNRERIYDIASQPSFETNGPFDVLLQNHGEAVHVHLAVDESLSAVTTLDATNQYVEADGQLLVRIETTSLGAPVTGRLKIVTGYGAESTYTTVAVSPPGTATDHVEVDERLAQPPPSDPTAPSFGDRFDGTALEWIQSIGLDRTSLALIGFSAVAVGLVLTVGTIVNSVVVLGGSLVVLGVVAALAVVYRQ